MFSYPLPSFIETVCADYTHGEEVVGWAETTGGEVALY